MWQDLHAHNYHYYLRYSPKIVIKNIIIAAIIIIAFFTISVSTDIYHDLFAGSVFLSIEIFIFIIIHCFQYLWMRSLSRLGYFRKRVLVVGKPDNRFSMEKLFQDVGNTKEYIGNLTIDDNIWFFKETDSEEVIEQLSVQKLLYRKNVGEVILFIDDKLSKECVYDIISFCRKNTVGYYLVPDIDKLPKKSPWDKPFAYIPVIERFTTTRDSLYAISIKRIIDIVFSLFACIVFFPFGLIIALAMKIEDGGPIFYISKRVGKSGKIIQFYKFRSMVIDAEKKKKDLLKFNDRQDGPLFKMKNDPRITRIGKFLRKTSLDEVPQFLNVIKGEMSIVGPRPHLPEEVAAYTDEDYLRLECIPGITCIPQILGRNSITFRKWVDYDLLYRKKWSLCLDFKLMFQTAGVVLKPIFTRQNHEY